MRWYEIAQLILTMVTAAVASAIGVATFFLDREVKLAGAKLEELSLQMEEEESERTFNLELFRLVLDSLERRDEERQDVLVAYFEALQDSRFKERMLIWFRSRATSIVAQKEASRSLGREVDRLVMAVAGMPGSDAQSWGRGRRTSACWPTFRRAGGFRPARGLSWDRGRRCC